MKKFFWALLFIVPATFLIVRTATTPPPRDYSTAYTNTVAAWGHKTFVPLRPIEAAQAALAGVEIENEDKLNAAQRAGLQDAIIAWWRAYSGGDKSNYIRFRLPEGVPWQWKPGAEQALSNYFVNGIVFSSDYLEDFWMRKYGHPDQVPRFVVYEELAREWSEEKRRQVRERWIAKYGDGSASLRAHRPREPWEQWLTIAFEQSGTNWWQDYWVGVCVREMVVQIVAYHRPPPPLQEFDFGLPHRRTGHDVDAPFPNMGISRMDRKSYIQWAFDYDRLLREQGQLLTANIYCMFQRQPPDYPEPALLRLVWVEKPGRWVPMELVDAHVMNTGRHTLFF
jgi:hypothetical protein